MPKEREKRDTSYFAAFGSDVKESRNTMKITRDKLAEQVKIEPRYLANLENSGKIPSLPVFRDIVVACKLPVERYFGLDDRARESATLERIKLKLNFCDEKNLPIIEAAIEAIIKVQEADNE